MRLRERASAILGNEARERGLPAARASSLQQIIAFAANRLRVRSSAAGRSCALPTPPSLAAISTGLDATFLFDADNHAVRLYGKFGSDAHRLKQQFEFRSMTAAYILGINMFVATVFAVAFGVVAATNRAALGARWMAAGYALGIVDILLEIGLHWQTDPSRSRSASSWSSSLRPPYA